jgi:hypothetical protein
MPDPSKLSFSSKFRYERVAFKGSIPFSLSGAFAITTVSFKHNLGYKPYIKAWYTYGDGKVFELFAGPNSYNIDGNGYQIDNANTTTTTFSVTISEQNGAGSSAAGRVYYRIYAEEQV